jgi:hypothetical protein
MESSDRGARRTPALGSVHWPLVSNDEKQWPSPIDVETVLFSIQVRLFARPAELS